jgi:DNA-binding NtrC family response regulator
MEAAAERLLIVEDDAGVSEVVQLLLTGEGYAVQHAVTVKKALSHLAANPVDLVITDLKLPDGTGLDVIASVHGRERTLPIILMTSYSSLESAIAALRAGATDYIVKPFNNEEFLHSVRRALHERRLVRENATLRRNLQAAYARRPLLGENAGVRKVLEVVRKVGASDANVLISGESGTGKELVALELHRRGPRADKPFVPVNCGAFAPAAALEAELFGSATGAERKEGLIREADGGTLFLEEVAELPLALQVKLLRVLDEKIVRPVGGRHSYAADVRCLTATNRNLTSAVEQGRFREDLYYRLNVISIDLPPLRERGSDVLLIAKHFLERSARKAGKTIRGFDPEFAAFMNNHAWPGNVRELENFIERSVLLADGEVLTGRDLAEVAPALPMVRASEPAAGDGRPLAIEEYIREIVERFQGTHSESELAKMLGIGRKALWMRRRQWGLKRSRKADH